MSVYSIRAHHGMCLYFFQGKGYSGEFVENMAKMREILVTETILRPGDRRKICGDCQWSSLCHWKETP